MLEAFGKTKKCVATDKGAGQEVTDCMQMRGSRRLCRFPYERRCLGHSPLISVTMMLCLSCSLRRRRFHSYLGETAATSPEEVFQSFDKFLGVVNLELQQVWVVAHGLCGVVVPSHPESLVARGLWLLQFLADKERAEKKARMDAAAAAKAAGSPTKGGAKAAAGAGTSAGAAASR